MIHNTQNTLSMRSLMCVLVFFPLFILGASCSSDSSNGNPSPVPPVYENRLTIMHTNDLHSHLMGYPEKDYDPATTGDGTTGGIARLSAKTNEIRAQRNAQGIPVLLLDAGDFMMGTMFALLEGEAEMSMLNEMGYNAVTLGNHEFDWLPAGAAEIVGHAAGLPVLATNLVIINPLDPGAAALQELIDEGKILPYKVFDLSNGISVGMFGLIGEDASDVVFRPDPENYPLEFSDPVEVATQTVNQLRNVENVDLVVCLSHLGVDDDNHNEGEDPDLAAAVPGIDVIVSGHTHTNMPDPVMVGNTVIVQAYEYCKRLGVLDLELTDTGVNLLSYEYITIDSTIPGDMPTENLVEQFIDRIDTEILNPIGYAYRQVVAETSFDLLRISGTEHNLGDLVTDGVRWSVDQIQGDAENPVFASVESDGVIRDDILKGKTGYILVADAFRAVPLGLDPVSLLPGYPLLSFWLTGYELKQAMEVDATAYPLLKNSDFWLSISGIRFTYASQGCPFQRVLLVWKCLDDTCEEMSEIDTSPENPTLYKVAVNYYVALNIDLLKEKTYGILYVVPKDEFGNPISDLTDAIVYEPGGGSLRQWEGFLDYLSSFEDTDGDSIPNIPDRYAGPQNRIVDVCFVATAAYGSPFEHKIDVLREFRDKILVRNAVGRKMVESYYHYGRLFAQAMEEHPWSKALVRLFLLPVIGLAKFLLWLA